MHLSTKSISLTLVIFSLVCCKAKKEEKNNVTQPNIIIILADDLGYGDVQSNNPSSKVPTPNINRLAREGLRFTDAHTPSAVCTPTRYGLLCGQYAWRTRLKSGVLNGYAPMLIDKGQPTVASVLTQQGYHTAVIGKWHLGLNWSWNLDSIPMKEKNLLYVPQPGQVNYNKPVTYGPKDVGFSYSYLVPASLDMGPYTYVENNRAVTIPNETFEKRAFPFYIRSGELSPDFVHEEVADHLTDKAKQYISERAKSADPFLLYFPLTAPHKPVMPHERFRGKSGIGLYGDFIIQVDWTVGEILNTLDKERIADNTLVILTSDNGSFMYKYDDGRQDHSEDLKVQGYRADLHTSNGIFRGTKADIWEGGHRVPFIVRWPSRIAGGEIAAKTICLTDVAATLSEITGHEFPEEKMEDSYSFASLLFGNGDFTRPPVVHHSVNGTFAIRKGNLKLVMSDGSGGREQPRGKPFAAPYQLFDMETDITETTNIAQDNPEKVQEMIDEFEKIARDIP